MNRWLWLSLFVYALLTSLLIVTVPINQAPDEGAHLEYVEYLHDHWKFPVFEPRGANFPGYEFHQPPLYYGISALTWKVLPDPVEPYAARIVSMLAGLVVLVLLWHSIRLLFPDDRVLAPLAIGFAAVWPMHIGVGASAGNDAIAGAMCAGMYWAVARFAVRVQGSEYSWRDAALVGAFFGLGMLSKSTSLVVGVAAIGATFHLARCSKSHDSRVAIMLPAVALAMAFVLCGWWLARNQVMYGDPLAARIFDEAFKNSSPRPQVVIAATGVSLLQYLRAIFVILFATCWGFFGGPNTAVQMLNPFGARGPRFEAFAALPLMIFPLVMTAIALGGIARYKLAAWKSGIKEYFSSPDRVALWWWGVGFVLVVLALARFNLIQYQAQARYLHPALLPMSLVFALGWLEILGRGLMLRVCVCLFGLALVALTLWNAFGWRTLV